MKNYLFTLLLLVCQAASSQVEKYHRVLIQVNPEKKQELFRMGISVDHSHSSPQGIQAEISDYEIGLLKEAAIPYQIIINDLTTYYQERNQNSSQHRENFIPNCNYPTVAVPAHFHLGSMGGYFTLSEMENILDSMKLLYPNLISVKQAISSTQSIEGRNIWYVKISDNPGIDENEPEVLYTALHHAREPESLSQLIFYMWHLLENYSLDPEVATLVNNRELFFVPCVNPDGYVYNETNSPSGGGMWRKNRRANADGSFGVDLNRNYGQDWGYDNIGSSPTPSTDVYRGTAAFSEPETQAMQSFCNSRQFVNALNAHTFGNDLIYPWGHIPSSYTPDNATYEAWGNYLIRDHRYVFGTCNETLNYLTNGDSDSWMYGEQTSKPKILAMTPETGGQNDGFWPASNRIIDLCKTTFTQNFKLAKIAGNCMTVTDIQDKFLSNTGYIKYKVQRLGLSPGSATVSIVLIGAGAGSSTGAQKVYSGLSLNQEMTDSIAFTLQGYNPGQSVLYDLIVNNEGANQSQPITKIYGTPSTVFYNNGSNLNNFDLVGSWGLFSNDYVSGPACITDSPLGNYGSDEHKTITTQGELNLTTAIVAHLQYYTKFRVEKSFDQVTLEVSTNNGASYAPICAGYETPPATFDGTDPVYDGRQDIWAKEDIDLSAYLGQKIKLRFKFDSDFYDERDGFYFDEFLVRIIQPSPPVGLNENNEMSQIHIYPNPSRGLYQLRGLQDGNITLTVRNTLGQSIPAILKNENQIWLLDLSQCPSGVYFVNFESEQSRVTKKLILQH